MPQCRCRMSEGNLWDSVVSFHHVGSRDQTWAMRLCTKRLCPLISLTSCVSLVIYDSVSTDSCLKSGWHEKVCIICNKPANKPSNSEAYLDNVGFVCMFQYLCILIVIWMLYWPKQTFKVNIHVMEIWRYVFEAYMCLVCLYILRPACMSFCNVEYWCLPSYCKILLFDFNSFCLLWG